MFKLSAPPGGQGRWTRTALTVFNGADGAQPYAGLTAAAEAGQTRGTETVLKSFTGRNGSASTAPVLLDGAGNVYGTTTQGGHAGDGVVFRLSR